MAVIPPCACVRSGAERCEAWTAVWAQVHRLWGLAKDGIPYDKREWNILHRQLQDIEQGRCACWQPSEP